jgi:hypothetical protein
MKYNLFLDDERIPEMVTWVNLPDVEWEIVSCYEQFVYTIEKNGLPEIVSFDHDLGESSYKEFHRAWNSDRVIKYSNIKEKTGYHACKWLVEYCLEKNLKFPQYYIHTMNSIGRDNIQSLIDSYNKVCKIET